MLILGFTVKVDADNCDKYACATCVYYINKNLKFECKLKSDGSGTADLRCNGENLNNNYGAASGYAPTVSHELRSENFINDSTKKIECIKKLYLKTESGGRGAHYSILLKEPKKQIGNYISISSIDLSTESKNNNLLVAKNGVEKGLSCSYNFPTIQGNNSVKTTITAVGDKLKYELSDGYKINENTNSFDVTVDDFKGTDCPKINGRCGSYGDDKYCYITKKDGQFDVLGRDEGQEGSQEIQGDIVIPTEPYKTTTLKHAYVGEGICGEEDVHKILKMVGYILIIAKVMVPLILIVIGTIDLYKAVIGKDEKDLTKSIKLLMLRIALGIFIFFIPTLVNLVIDSIKNPVGDKENNAQCISCVLDPINC